MNKLILAAMSAGILSGCSSAPQLAAPKGEFVDLNTDITSLLPHTEPIYTGATTPNVTKSSLVKNVSKAVVKEASRNSNSVTPHKGNNKPNLFSAGELKAKPLTPRGFVTPVTTTAQKVNETARGSNIPPSAIKISPSSNQKINISANEVVTAKLAMPLTAKASQSKPPQPLLKAWEIKKGTNLIDGYMKWVESDKCLNGDGGKWRVDKQTETNYSIDYPLKFNAATFEDATAQLFNLYRKAEVPLYVDGFRNQCLIVISDRK